MRLRLSVAAVLVALAVAAAPAAARPHGAKRLRSFGSCETLVGYAARHVPPAPVRREVPPPTGELPVPQEDGILPVPAPIESDAGTGDDTSQTNVQEAGVDEPDIVKTDGRTIFALANGRLHAVAARTPTPQLLGTLEIGRDWSPTLLLRRDRALIIGTGPRGARMTEVDVGDPTNMTVLRSEYVDGHIVDARLTGRTARVVVASFPKAVYGPPELRALPSGWLPMSTLENARSGKSVTQRAVRCRSVRRPSAFSGAGVLTVHTVDLAKGLPAIDADAIFTSADTVYASPFSLYVATQRWQYGRPAVNTAIHRFDTSDPERTQYSASGVVHGTLFGQFAMSENKAVLRVATTAGFGAAAESGVTTLDERGGRLLQRGHVGGLGRGERIYAVRFIDDAGYVVTFRQTDPLYTLDLSDPDHPRVAGQLKIPGYSAYLHPVGEELLLGVGQDATDDGRIQGLQLSLFDVSDLGHPTRLQKERLSERWSQSAVEWDHHAFLWWPATRLAVLPIDSQDFTGVAGFRVDRARGISELGRVRHDNASWTPSIDRAVVVGRRLFTISNLGVKASGLESFAGAGWAAFPDPPGPVDDLMPAPAAGGPAMLR